MLVEDPSTGGKATGLLGLPSQWVPRFLSISADLFRRWCSAGSARSLASIVSDADRDELERAIANLDPRTGTFRLIVRSNAVDEDLNQRGALLSERADSTADGVLTAAEYVFRHAFDVRPRPSLGLIVQRFTNRVMYGHLSNLRRVSEEPRSWACETSPFKVLFPVISRASGQ